MDLCLDSAWQPTTAAPTLSALSSVLAGFVFAGVVLLLQRSEPDRRPPHSLRLLISSFMVLSVCALLYATMSGEGDSLRSWTQAMVSAGLLGTGSLGVLSGVAWLAIDSHPRYAEAARYTATIATWLASAIAVFLLTTAVYYLRDIYPEGMSPPTSLAVFVWLLPTVLEIALLLLVVAQRRGWDRSGERFIKIAADLSVASSLGCMVCFNLAGGLVGTAGQRPRTWAVATAVLCALALSAVAVIAQVLALPTRARPDIGGGAEPTAMFSDRVDPRCQSGGGCPTGRRVGTGAAAGGCAIRAAPGRESGGTG